MRKQVLQSQAKVRNPLFVAGGRLANRGRSRNDGHLRIPSGGRWSDSRGRFSLSRGIHERDFITFFQSPFDGSTALVYRPYFDLELLKTGSLLQVDRLLAIFLKES